MKPKYLVLKFSNDNRELYFENKVIVIEDKKLIENLRRPNIKNADSLLTIKSKGNIHISDVVQIKINLEETGFLLASFDKSSMDEKKREALLKEIGALKNKKEITKTVQTNKIKDLIKVLNKYKPIYVSFENSGELKINTGKLAEEPLEFPFLVLSTSDKKLTLKIKIREKSSKKPEKVVKEDPKKAEPKKEAKPKKAKVKKAKSYYAPIPLFDIDYFFVFIFSLLGAFAITTAVFEFLNKQGTAIFLTILGAAFVIVLTFSMQSTIYKKGKEINPFLRYFLSIFIIAGIAGGIAGGYFVSKLVLKTEIENFDYKFMLIISCAVSVVALLSSVTTSRLVNLIVKKSRNKSE